MDETVKQEIPISVVYFKRVHCGLREEVGHAVGALLFRGVDGAVKINELHEIIRGFAR